MATQRLTLILVNHLIELALCGGAAHTKEMTLSHALVSYIVTISHTFELGAHLSMGFTGTVN
jgi:hypothetical protein